MDENKKLDLNDPEAIPGVICKAASVSPLACTDDDLAKINKYTLTPKTAEDVFIFKMTIADNGQDDRNFMPFNLKAIKDLKKLYVGKTMIFDHRRSAANQVARVFDTEIVTDEKATTELGETFASLIAKAYMIRTESNKDLIAEIDGGIKKEVSTSTVPEKMICNICGADNMKEYCRHWPGVTYETTDATGKSEKKVCKMLLYGAKEAYELSFVAVPAQPRAGAHKCAGFAKPCPEEETVEGTDKNAENEPVEAQAGISHGVVNENSCNAKEETENMDERILMQSIKNAESFLICESEE